MISEKQKKILAFSYTKFDALICDGAIRSGKTSLMTVAFIDWAMREFNNTNFAICGKTVGSAIKNIVIPYLAMGYSKKYRCRLTRSDNKLLVSSGSKTNTFYIYGGKDESSYMLIQGITLAGVLLDEIVLMTRSFVEQALARCSVLGSKFWFNCNPESPNHWFYVEWIKDQQPKKHNALHLHFLIDDNPGLDDEIKKRYVNMYSGVFYERYILGMWVVAKGAIYRVFSDDKKKYYVDKPDYDFIQIGIDFGGNNSAHSFTATGLKNDYSKLTVLMTERHIATGSSPETLYALFGKFLERVKEKYGNIFAIYADSAEQVLINGLKARFPMYIFRNSIKHEIVDRIRAVTGLMGQGRFYITDECKSLDEALCTAVYDSKQIKDTRLDDGTSDIDSLDSFEYSFESYLKHYAKKSDDNVKDKISSSFPGFRIEKPKSLLY